LNASGGAEYEWSGPNNFSATGSAASIKNIQPAQAGKYYLEVTSDAGCKKSDSVDVLVNISPVANVSFLRWQYAKEIQFNWKAVVVETINGYRPQVYPLIL
jgi:hypothetical protein